MTVLLDELEKANALLDGSDSSAERFGAIRYYEGADLARWYPGLDPIDTLGLHAFFDLQQDQAKHPDES